jgi:DNA polymerase III subunit delta
MVAVKAGEVAAALRRPDPRAGVYLFYGPDTGLMAERARLVAERSVEDPTDPFQLIRIDGDALIADPARLSDEAGTIGLFGGRRVIWVRATARNIAPAVEPVLDAPLQDTVIVIEGGDLARSAPLRTLCERSPRALALPCYPDEGRGLGEVVDGALREAGLEIGRDARAVLLASLGGDRLASRAELAKLTLYAHGAREITVDDIDAILSDVSGLALDSVIDAAFAGDLAGLDNGSRRLAAEGMHPSVVLGAALRHAMALLPARIEVEGGRSAETVAEAWRGLHFRRKPFVKQHLQRWTSTTVKAAIERLQASLLDTRRLSDLGDVIVARVLLDLARTARRPA